MTIDEFRENIVQFSSGGFMSLNGAESILGTNNGTYAVQNLQRVVVEFTHQYKTGDEDSLKQARKELTAKIMVAQTLGVMSEQTADEFLDDIALLMKQVKERK